MIVVEIKAIPVEKSEFSYSFGLRRIFKMILVIAKHENQQPIIIGVSFFSKPIINEGVTPKNF